MTVQNQSKSIEADNLKVYLIAAVLGAGVGLVSIAFLFAVLSLKNLKEFIVEVFEAKFKHD
jgi:undecaprenyl pyrophosphate phosphatase UppP